MKQTITALLSVTLSIVACTTQTQQKESISTAYNEEQPLPGDSTIYGLACEGCTDSILVFLPFTGGDPDTLDILNARILRHVFGHPDIGDELAIIINGTDSTIADLVIDLDKLKGSWCYQVLPHLRPRIGTTDNIDQLPTNFPDSLRQKWFLPREYGFELRNYHTVRPIGGERRETERQQGPVEYPEAKRYREWYIYNGHLLLSETRRDTAGIQQVISTDTADIVMMRRDSLHLQFANYEQGYYRKQ